VLVALTFDFLNGFHDAANSIATVVSTRVLSPKLAVVWAAFFNFVAAFFFGTAVANTIGRGMIDLEIVTQYVVLRAAIVRGWGKAFGVILASGWTKTVLFIFIAPVMGLVLGFTFMVMVSWIFRRSAPRQVDTWFRKLQLISAACYSLGHGGNDAQKTMGIIAGALYAGGVMTRFDMAHQWGKYHWPIILSAHFAIAMGTYFGGWRIVHTMGSKITKLKPVGGFCAEAAGAITLFGTAMAGIPVSTTHTITGAIIGVGTTVRLSAVRWGVAQRIVWAWVVTIPASALVSAAGYWLLHLLVRGA
jgi:PiT family inorganic phosphate transporter